MPQLLLFPDPRPLVERLGRQFFQTLPESPGVYLMQDAASTVLYVGKAKNLRKRLNSYRVANPDRVARRHLRMLRCVDAISFETCADEPAALARESELLLSLKPKFNRAGTYRPPPQFLIWRATQLGLELRLSQEPEMEFASHGPMFGGAKYFHASLTRLLWWALHPGRSLFNLPAGWIHSRLGSRAVIPADDPAREAVPMVESLLRGEVELFSQWIQEKTSQVANESEKSLRAEDLETISRLVLRTEAVILTKE